jgi:hypothetical protein
VQDRIASEAAGNLNPKPYGPGSRSLPCRCRCRGASQLAARAGVTLLLSAKWLHFSPGNMTNQTPCHFANVHVEERHDSHRKQVRP